MIVSYYTDMEEFLKRMMDDGQCDPPERCLETFRRDFPHATYAEWHRTNEWYESVFYEDKLEHIARFDNSGKLLDHKMFLPESLLPEKIRKLMKESGEIMNAVLINKGTRIEYEVIIRDAQLNRKLISFSQSGHILGEKEL